MQRKGWHHRGYIPHYDGYDVAQHIVFSLADAIPEDEETRGYRALDLGFGMACLRDAACAKIVTDALMHFNEERYGLRAWCVMPTHVHVLIMTKREHGIGEIVSSWKSFTARRINTHLNRAGRLWSPDYFDRFIRDSDHYATTMRYIERNPVAAGLCRAPEDWAHSSASWPS
jgi:REP element-mobilizing transposase RayT